MQNKSGMSPIYFVPPRGIVLSNDLFLMVPSVDQRMHQGEFPTSQNLQVSGQGLNGVGGSP